MKLRRNLPSTVLALLLALLLMPAGVHAATNPGLGTAGTFAALAGSTITNTGSTVVTGNLGVYPGTAVTGFPPGTEVGGTIHAGDTTGPNNAQQAQNDASTAYSSLQGQACDQNVARISAA